MDKSVTTLQGNQDTVAENTVTPSSAFIAYVIWGLDLSGTLQGAGGVGGLLAVFRDDGIFAPTYDANGNISEYVSLVTRHTSLATSPIVAHYEYSPFGETIAQSGDLADTFTHRFSTKPWCPITATSEYQYRQYKPETGRWMNRDPILEEGGENLYGFVDNSPIIYFDIYGTRGSGSTGSGGSSAMRARQVRYNNATNNSSSRRPPSPPPRSNTRIPLPPPKPESKPITTDPTPLQEALENLDGAIENTRFYIPNPPSNNHDSVISEGKYVCSQKSPSNLTNSGCKCCVISYYQFGRVDPGVLLSGDISALAEELSYVYYELLNAYVVDESCEKIQGQPSFHSGREGGSLRVDYHNW